MPDLPTRSGGYPIAIDDLLDLRHSSDTIDDVGSYSVLGYIRVPFRFNAWK